MYADCCLFNKSSNEESHCKQSLVLFHANDLCDYCNFDYNTPTQVDNNQTEIQ